MPFSYVTICESNMLSSRVKISYFRTKAHLVFQWCLYNKMVFVIVRQHKKVLYLIKITMSDIYSYKFKLPRNLDLLNTESDLNLYL